MKKVLLSIFVISFLMGGCATTKYFKPPEFKSFIKEMKIEFPFLSNISCSSTNPYGIFYHLYFKHHKSIEELDDFLQHVKDYVVSDVVIEWFAANAEMSSDKRFTIYILYHPKKDVGFSLVGDYETGFSIWEDVLQK